MSIMRMRNRFIQTVELKSFCLLLTFCSTQRIGLVVTENLSNSFAHPIGLRINFMQESNKQLNETVLGIHSDIYLYIINNRVYHDMAEHGRGWAAMIA